MKCNEINIRDPFVLYEDGKYYLYGTRAENFGQGVGGMDVYISEDLIEWSEPLECFNSIAYGMNRNVNWAPEVHKYNGLYYMFATFTRENGLRGTYILKAQSPLGPFEPHSRGAVTPEEWECLDGTLYINKEGKPYMVFCHEHTQIIDGTMCYVELSEDLTCAKGEPVTMFKASSPYWADKLPEDAHRVTDGPFMHRTKDGTLLMIWSTFIKEQYAECVVRFKNQEIGMEFEHLAPIIDDDGGHGMIFRKDDTLMLTYHTPNTKGEEHPVFCELVDCGDHLELPEMRKRVICCIGDSLTEGDYGMYGVTGVANVQEKNYPYFLAKELACVTRNYGRCGLRADQYLDYYMENNLNMSDADVVMIMLGTNGGHSVTEDTVPNESYKKLIEVIQKDAPEAKVVLVTPPHVTKNPEFANHWYRTHVEVSVEFVRNVAEKEDVYLIDAAKYEEFNDETEKIYQKNDGLHYVEEGYQEMARFFSEKIREFFPEMFA